MEVKQYIKDESALEAVVASQIVEITKQTHEEVGALEKQYVQFRHYQRVGFLIIAASFLLPNFAVFVLEVFFVNLTNIWSTLISIGVFVISLALCAYYGGKFLLSGSDVIRMFHAKVDRVLFAKIFTIFNLKGKLIEHTVVVDKKEVDGNGSKWRQLFEIIRAHFRSLRESEKSERVMMTLASSELITEPFNTTRIDNIFEITLGDKILFVSELHVQNITGSGRSRSVNEIFRGYFVSTSLKGTLKGKTFVSTEGDLHGFARRTYWSGLTNEKVKETIFEWNDFEELLHVATDNEKEARHVLSTDFMTDLYDWWKIQSNANIRLSFIGNNFYMLFPDKQIRFEDTVSEVEEKQLQEYLLTIARPLLHVLHLVEDIKI
jgi:membrane protein implicated in regulation of membrane protease activity